MQSSSLCYHYQESALESLLLRYRYAAVRDSASGQSRVEDLPIKSACQLILNSLLGPTKSFYEFLELSLQTSVRRRWGQRDSDNEPKYE